VIGSDAEPDTRLSSHDWHNEAASCPWNQGEVRQGMISMGHWAIDVARAGTYRVEVRRWPREVESTLTQGVGVEPPPDEGVDPKALKWYVGGVALPLRRVRLRVGSQEFAADVDAEAQCVEFSVQLPTGPSTLEAWFIDKDEREIGAYYVYVTNH